MVSASLKNLSKLSSHRISFKKLIVSDKIFSAPDISIRMLLSVTLYLLDLFDLKLSAKLQRNTQS